MQSASYLRGTPDLNPGIHAQTALILHSEFIVVTQKSSAAASGPQVFGSTFLQVTSVAESAAGPSTGIQGFVGLLGVLAVPVVGYSLFTLYKTGAIHIFKPCSCLSHLAFCSTNDADLSVATHMRCRGVALPVSMWPSC